MIVDIGSFIDEKPMGFARNRLQQGRATATRFSKDHQQLSAPDQPLKIAQYLDFCLTSTGDFIEQADHFE